MMHDKSKHIDMRYHFLRELENDGVAQLQFCGTMHQLADILTKPMELESFRELRWKFGVCDILGVN